MKLSPKRSICTGSGPKQSGDILQSFADQLLAAHMAHLAGGDEGGVAAVLFCLGRGQVALGTVGQLNQEGLLGGGAGLDLVAGTVIGMIVFVVIPLLWIMRFSVFKYKGCGSMTFVGLDNFVRVFTRSDRYWLAVKNTFVFAIGKLLVEIPLALALVLAFVLTRRLKG